MIDLIRMLYGSVVTLSSFTFVLIWLDGLNCDSFSEFADRTMRLSIVLFLIIIWPIVLIMLFLWKQYKE